MATTRKQLNRDDWLAHALDVLASEGVAAVRVEPLARSLGVTKGSFYWHFTDRDDLLEELLKYWDRKETLRLMRDVEADPGDGRAKLLKLMYLIHDMKATSHELAVRSWAFYDERAAKFVRRVDEERYAFVAKLFRQAGFRGQDAEIRTRLFVYYEVAQPMVFQNQTPDQQRQLIKRRHALLTSE